MMKNTCIVIVDRYRTCGYRLRNRLLAREAKICVFHTFPPALELLKHKTVDAVVLDFGLDEETTAFCAAAKALRVPIVFACTGTREEFVGGLADELPSSSPIIALPS